MVQSDLGKKEEEEDVVVVGCHDRSSDQEGRRRKILRVFFSFA